jgi:hypothetical protein
VELTNSPCHLCRCDELLAADAAHAARAQIPPVLAGTPTLQIKDLSALRLVEVPKLSYYYYCNGWVKHVKLTRVGLTHLGVPEDGQAAVLSRLRSNPASCA